MTITLEQAIRLLEDASGLIIDGDLIVYGEVWDDKDDETFLQITWDEGDGTETIRFNRSENQNPTLVGSSLFLSEAGDIGLEDPQVQITLLKPWDVEEELKKTKTEIDLPSLAEMRDTIANFGLRVNSEIADIRCKLESLVEKTREHDPKK